MTGRAMASWRWSSNKSALQVPWCPYVQGGRLVAGWRIPQVFRNPVKGSVDTMSALRNRTATGKRDAKRRSLTRKGRAVASCRRLSRSDKSLVQAILDHPVDFVDSESFHKPRAKQTLFDKADPVRRADVAWYRPLIDDVVGTRPESKSTKDSIVLTRDEERTIFLQYNYARFKVASMQKRLGNRKPTPRQSTELLYWYRLSRQLRDQIAESNLALVLAMAKRARINAVDFSDQISEGNMALLRSVDKFDVGRGFKFSTYACRAILKGFYRQGMKDTRHRQRFPTTFDPAMEAGDPCENRRREDQFDSAREVKQLMQENKADLSSIELVVLQHRFGFEPGRSGRPLTLAQVGKLIGVTKERVRQIQNKALGKLREAVEQRCLPRTERDHPGGIGFSIN